MKDLLADVDRWLAEGRPTALARIVAVEGSGPRPPGAAMAVVTGGEVAGSLSGGCIDGVVVGEALQLLESGTGPRLLTFGPGDDDPFAAGPTCGGTIVVFVEELSWVATYRALREEIRAGRAATLATVVEGRTVGRSLLVRPGRERLGTLGDDDLDRIVARDGLVAAEVGQSSLRRYDGSGDACPDRVGVFLDAHGRPPSLVVLGAVDFTAALVRVARSVGYTVTVCDARAAFATRRRFPDADHVEVDWPHRYLERVGPSLGPADAVIVLTHDERFDVPAVRAAMATDVGYLGAMGSRRTTADRRRRLLEEGIEARALERLHAPVGLDLGARTPEETALSICAGIVAHRRGRSGRPLGELEGPIHGAR